MTEAKNEFILGILVNNQAGVLNRVTGLFARRNYNIESLNVAVTEDPSVSRMTIISRGDEIVRTQIKHQLEKLYDVIKVEIMSEHETLMREHLLIKIKVDKDSRSGIVESVNIFRGKVVDFNVGSITVEMTGESLKLDAFIRFAEELGIIEMSRAGAVALHRGDSAFAAEKNGVE